ncbi:MAG: hypothetical protein MZV65_48805 [Chromatiales bacterium]|nr:hypothetical protein [Chromatiales bacterium]
MEDGRRELGDRPWTRAPIWRCTDGSPPTQAHPGAGDSVPARRAMKVEQGQQAIACPAAPRLAFARHRYPRHPWRGHNRGACFFTDEDYALSCTISKNRARLVRLRRCRRLRADDQPRASVGDAEEGGQRLPAHEVSGPALRAVRQSRLSLPPRHVLGRRIGGIRPQDYTRMGFAIRHLTKLLDEVEARTKLLITLSDGKPDDYHDGYRGKYGIEDTRKALQEAQRGGIHPFCITIDKEAPRLPAPPLRRGSLHGGGRRRAAALQGGGHLPPAHDLAEARAPLSGSPPPNQPRTVQAARGGRIGIDDPSASERFAPNP